MTTTDRRDADDATFAAELARLDRLPVADPWRDQIADALRPHRYDSVGMICDCGVECGVVCDGLTREEHLADVVAALKPAPGTDSSGQAVQRVDRIRVLRAIEAAEVSIEHDVPVDWPEFLAGLRAAIAALKPAPGTDSSGQAVQRVLALHQRREDRGDVWCDGCRAECLYCEADHPWPCPTVAAVAGPQRDHEEEGQ